MLLNYQFGLLMYVYIPHYRPHHMTVSYSVQSLLQLLARSAKILEPLVDDEFSISSGNNGDQITDKYLFYAQCLAAMYCTLW